jgi:hypothetical protein
MGEGGIRYWAVQSGRVDVEGRYKRSLSGGGQVIVYVPFVSIVLTPNFFPPKQDTETASSGKQ